MLLRMIEEEGGVAVVRNNSNDEQTPYIPLKKPSTLPLNSAQTTNKKHHRPTLPSECENYAVVTLFFLNFPYLLQDLLS